MSQVCCLPDKSYFTKKKKLLLFFKAIEVPFITTRNGSSIIMSLCSNSMVQASQHSSSTSEVNM